jgi:RNA polymerase sigma-70 factor, ECF subfamily
LGAIFLDTVLANSEVLERIELPAAVLELLRERWCEHHGAGSETSPEGQPTDGFLAFVQLVDGICTRYRFGVTPEKTATEKERTAFAGSLRLDDLLLARECAEGRPEAWERFMTLYRVTLYQAAYGIARSDSAGRELADSLYADLFGLREKDGERQSPLMHYHGRGSLAGWLRSVLAQRFVDKYRAGKREVPLEEEAEFADASANASNETLPTRTLSLLERTVQAEIQALKADERFLLSTYYLDGRTLKQIAGVLGVHESTVSRAVTKLGEQMRKRVSKRLMGTGLSRRQVEEMLAVDVRDLEIPLKKILQGEGAGAFKDQEDQDFTAEGMVAGRGAEEIMKGGEADV